MAQGRLRKAVDKSIRHAVSSGNLDLEQSAAPIAMLRYMADNLDSDSGETPMMRYVTPASFLSYCDSLGLLPDGKKPAKPKQADESNIVTVVGRSKWAQNRMVGE